MAPNDGRPRGTSQQADQIINALREMMDARMPMPSNHEPAALVDERLRMVLGGYGQPPAINLPPHVLNWLSGKSAKDLERIDEAMDHWITGRLAFKILVYIGGAAVTVLTFTFAATRWGIDLFGLLKGGKS